MSKLTEYTAYIEYKKVYSKATTYPDSVRIFIPNEPYTHESTISSGHKSKAYAKDFEDQSNLYETNEERSIRRTRKLMKGYALCNDFQLFCTFTMGTDRFNDERSLKRMKNWLKNQRDRNGKFRYLVVTERHKNGAMHFHGLFGDYSGKLEPAVNPKDGELLTDKYGTPVFNFSEYTHGITTAEVISGRDDRTRTAYYIQKYIGKDLTAESGKNRYWASKGLKRPVTQDNPASFYEGVKPAYKQQLDHGVIYEFVKGQSPEIDAYIEAHQA